MNVNWSRFVFAAGMLFGAQACSSLGTPGALPDDAAQFTHAAAPVRSSTEHVRIEEFRDLPRGYNPFYFPTALAVRGYALWVADDIDQDAGESAVIRVSPSGNRTKAIHYQNDASPAFEGIADGPDGALWLTDFGDGLIARVTVGGQITTYPLAPYDLGEPQGITAGPDRALWFADDGFYGAIGRIDLSGHISIYKQGLSQGAVIQGITLGPDGALWFAESSGDRIGRITVQGKITEFSAGITAGSEPYSIAAGPDGALWFTELQGGRIGRITTKGNVTEYSRGITPTENPNGIAAGPDGTMWFTESQGAYFYRSTDARIGRITTKGKVTEYLVPTGKSGPTGIVQGPDGNMWFVETNANKLGRVDLYTSPSK
ncbi:MAG TPA: hypothetical protein VHX17_09150 [Candidatus Cybelea sp.]|jgi:streptogramin lyase|nr:hypothetical protein [Candidatus Cybelea sp.]